MCIWLLLSIDSLHNCLSSGDDLSQTLCTHVIQGPDMVLSSVIQAGVAMATAANIVAIILRVVQAMLMMPQAIAHGQTVGGRLYIWKYTCTCVKYICICACSGARACFVFWVSTFQHTCVIFT